MAKYTCTLFQLSDLLLILYILDRISVKLCVILNEINVYSEINEKRGTFCLKNHWLIVSVLDKNSKLDLIKKKK